MQIGDDVVVGLRRFEEDARSSLRRLSASSASARRRRGGRADDLLCFRLIAPEVGRAYVLFEDRQLLLGAGTSKMPPQLEGARLSPS